jgi:hypothetical protein
VGDFFKEKQQDEEYINGKKIITNQTTLKYEIINQKRAGKFTA